MSPRRLYRTTAIAEMITWAGLITALVIKYTGVTDLAVTVAGSIHGFVFLCYVLTNVFVGFNQGWTLRLMALGVGSAVIPFLTYPYDRWLEKNGRLDGPWRTDGSGLRGWVLRHPLLAVLAALVLVSGVFAFLLWLGPPTGWATRFS